MPYSTDAIEQTPAAAQDEPETPAPVFAMRAFKHALFGTPAPPAQTYSTATSRAEPAASRNSTHLDPPSLRERERGPRKPNTRHSMPDVARRATQVSPDREQVVSREEGKIDVLADATSPAKKPGILLTPGTGGNRRKTVSFFGGKTTTTSHDQQKSDTVAGERRRSNKTEDQSKPKSKENAEPSRPRRVQKGTGSFAERLKNTTSDTATNANNTGKQVVNNVKSTNETNSPDDITIDMSAPRSTSGKYWKSEFETYSSKSELEMRKLAKKEQVAKRFAQSRDENAADLEEQLQHEQERVVKLEQDVQAYVTRLGKAVGEGQESMSQKATRGSQQPGPDEAAKRELDSLRRNNVKLRRLAEDREKEIERLSRENEQLRRTATTATSSDLRKRTSTSNLEAQKPQQPHHHHHHHHHQSSDIWNDLGATNKPTTTTARTDSTRTRQSSRRSPLAPRTNDADPSHPSPTGATIGLLDTEEESPLKKDKMGSRRGASDGKRAGLTEERREAARKRLEERRRNREMSGV